MILELYVADVIHDHNIKMDAMHLKITKIKIYVIHTKAWYHYAVGSIVTLVAIMIAFVVAFKCLHSCMLVSMLVLVRCSREIYVVLLELCMNFMYLFFQ